MASLVRKLALSTVFFCGICGVAQAAGPVKSAGSFTGATANLAPNDPPGQWTSQGRDYANTRYSPLAQITKANVARLKVAWTFSDGEIYGRQGAPLVVGDTMYVVTPFPNIAFALDLSKAGAPIKWEFQPHPDPASVGEACCGVVLRGWAYGDGKLIYNLLDNSTVAVDAKTGTEVWRTKLDDVKTGSTLTASTAVFGDKVYVGNSGGEMGDTGWLSALDLKTGKIVWRANSNGPDKDVLIGSDFKPFYSYMQGKDLGVSTWPPGMYKQGASAPWGWITFDPDLNEVYYGTSNPGPRTPEQRPGINLWSSALFARDLTTGDAKWAYQYTPHDEWDYDGINENIPIEIPWKGGRRKVLVHFDRNGFGYTIDRTNGEVLVAQPFGYENWAKSIDLTTGLPVVDPTKENKVGIVAQDVCPPDIGVKNWEPSAFSPRTGLFYVAAFNNCWDLSSHVVQYIAGAPYNGMEGKNRRAGPGGNWGEIIAWDPVKGKRVWTIPEDMMTWGGLLTTGSDLIFYGTLDGWVRAADARTGKVLWSQKIGSGIMSPPISYLGPDHRQYIAVYAGVGGGTSVAGRTPGYPPGGNTLYVFSVDGISNGSGPSQLHTVSTVAVPRSNAIMGGGRPAGAPASAPAAGVAPPPSVHQ